MDSAKLMDTEKKSIILGLFKNPFFWLGLWLFPIFLSTIFCMQFYPFKAGNFFTVLTRITLTVLGGLYILVYVLIKATSEWLPNNWMIKLLPNNWMSIIVLLSIWWISAINAVIYMRKSNNRKWIIRIGIALIILTILSFIGFAISIYKTSIISSTIEEVILLND